MRDERRIAVGGVGFDPVSDHDLADRIRSDLDRGTGGWATVPDLDMIARAQRDPLVRAALASADLVVASGATLLLASRLAGHRLPAPRGSTLIWSLLSGLSSAGRSVYLFGGEPDVGGVAKGARRAASVVAFACPGTVVAGHASPRQAPGVGGDWDVIVGEIVNARPDVVLAGTDVASQAWLAASVRAALPGTWVVGIDGAMDLIVGRRRSLGRRLLPGRHQPATTVHLLAAAARGGAGRSTRVSPGNPGPDQRARRSADPWCR